MTTAVQRRRGTNTEHASFTGLEGEISVNTTNESVHVHDGSTAGGFELMRADGANSTVTLGDISGVTAGTGLSGGGTTGTVTLDIDGTVATLAGTQTFTNKTLTSPILNTPTIGTSFTIGGATITETELEILDGATVTTTELNYVDGVTSAIQTQIDAKAPLASPSFTGNVSVGGTVDGRDLAADGTKLDLINQGVATTDSPTFDDGTFTGILNITPTSGYGHIEVGGVDGAFIDLKSPSSDDYDLRLITSGGSGGTIDVGSTGDLSFNAGGSERARLLATGNVGIGTASPSKTLVINENDSECVAIIKSSDTGTAGLFLGGQTDEIKGGIVFNNSDNSLQLRGHNNTERMRILADGKVGIGTASPTEKLEVNGHIKINNGFADGGQLVLSSLGYSDWNNDNTVGAWRLYNGATERMRLDTAGSLLLGKTTSASNVQGFRADQIGKVYSSIPSGNTYHLYDTTNNVFTFYVGYTGGVINYQANNVNLSDEREKKNIEPLESKWDSVKSWSLKTFHYNHQADESIKNYGVIAQDVEQTNPEAIDVYQKDEDTERKGVKEQQMMWMAIKALQEAQTRIETLETRIAALEE